MKVIVALALCILPALSFAQAEHRKVCIKDACLQAEVADSADEHSMGLMYRRKLPDNGGMLFIFDREDVYSFWMKNMRFDLDIVWVSEDKTVVDIKTNVPACQEGPEPCPSFIPCCKAKFALELNAGFVKLHNISIGDKVLFP